MHTDFASWPEWQPGVGGLRPGSAFRWYVEGLDVTSTVRHIDPPRRLVWGGPANGIEGIHVWAFTAVGDRVLVSTEESWSGEPVEADIAYAQHALDSSLAQWLHWLKERAEALAPARGWQTRSDTSPHSGWRRPRSPPSHARGHGTFSCAQESWKQVLGLSTSPWAVARMSCCALGLRREGETSMGPFDVPLDDERTQLDAFVEEYRSAIEATLDGLTEEQARRRLVPSATTLLGLLKHVTWMQRVWFEECVGGTPRQELGLVRGPDESFRLADGDTIASVKAAHREAHATARAVVANLPLDAVATGHRTGPRTVRWVYLQVLRELAHHCGHADILREQVLAR